jgi:hypothetical protein
MTPQERSLVIDLFDRLAEVEDSERDPEAERAISDGLRRAPNAVYALVQTALVQDEALKQADARIRALEAQVRKAPQRARSGSFLSGMREAPSERRGSVPPARPVDAPALAPTDDRGPPSPMPAGPGPGNPGGSFLGTAAAAAAGAIGGSLMLNSIRSMMGPRQGAGGFAPAMASPAKASESASPQAAAAAGSGNAAHEAGHDTLTKDDEARSHHGEDQVEDDDDQGHGDYQGHSDYDEHGEYEDHSDYDEDSEQFDDGDFDDGSGDFDDGGGDFGGGDEP